MNAEKKQYKKSKALYNSQIQEQWHFINDLTNNLVVGHKCILKGSPAYGDRYRNSREQIFDHLERKKFAKYKRTFKIYRSHCRSNCTAYFTGTSQYNWEKQRETLFCIDIDCHKGIGSKQGAKNCVQFLERWFPGIKWEHSTGGIGITGWIILDRKHYTPEELNSFYKKLKNELRKLVPLFDISDIEITGTCPVFKWVDGKVDRREPREGGSNVGVFGALPRTPGLSSTTRITVPQLKDIIASIRQYCDEEGLIAKKNDSERKPVGRSIGGDFIKFAHHGGKEKWEKLAQELIKKLPQVTAKKKLVVNYEDMACFLFISWWCSLPENRNENRTLPMNRIEGLWLYMFAEGDVDRQHNHSRAGAMRNCMDSLNMIEWHDPHHTNDKACEWNLTDKVMDLIEGILDESVPLYNYDLLVTYLAVAEIYLKPISEWVRPVWVYDGEAEYLKLLKYFPDAAAA